MKYVFAVVAVLACACPSAVWAQDKQERKVIVAEGDKLPKIKVGDIIRLTQSGAAGKAEITVSVEGPVKLESTTAVRRYRDGKPLIGAVTKEFEFKAEKKGKAVIKITVDDVVSKKAQIRELELEIE